MTDPQVTKFEQLTNTYIKIITPHQNREVNTLIKLGSIHQSEHFAGYTIQICDWCGDTSVLKNMRRFQDFDIGDLSYALSFVAVPITEAEFFSGLAREMIELAKRRKQDGEVTFLLTFKSTPERRAMFEYLLKQSKVDGLVL
jgi:hypothetical protein